MKSDRYLNGYKLIYQPDHPSSMTSKNWEGYIYEHIAIAEKSLERQLRENEVVHHLDLSKDNNRRENLLVLEKGQHAKLHAWLDKGAPGWERPGENRVNSKKPKACTTCNRTLQNKQVKFCSTTCRSTFAKEDRPPKEQLLQEVENLGYEATGRLYGVTGNSIRKWLR